MTFIDIHCHIEMCSGNPADIIRRANDNEVSIIVNNGVNPESNRRVLQISERFKEIKAALGLYPIDALKLTDEEIDSELEFIRKNKNKIIAIGEVGLDFKEDVDNIERQKKTFQKIINLALELNIPIIIHSRKAEKECIEMLEKSKFKKVVMHCFSGNFNLVGKIIENGWTFSIPANVVFSEHFQKVVEITPISQLLCETDSPYLHPKKERDNEPANVIEGYKKIADIKNLKVREVEKSLEDNYKRLFY